MNSRREFIVKLSLGGAVLAGAGHAQSQAAMVAENDPQATGLGYKADASKVDKAKFPKYAAGQTCANCALYQGKAGAASGPCALFPGKDVTAKGWCQAYAKKA